jgi:hypothetical protein
MYAGILGPVAFTAILTRSLVHGGGVETTLKAAMLCLFTFAVIGYIAGKLADRIVTDSVRSRFYAELEARESAAADKATKTS